MADQPDREAIEKAQKVLYDEGMKIREQVLGTAHVQNSRGLRRCSSRYRLSQFLQDGACVGHVRTLLDIMPRVV